MPHSTADATMIWLDIFNIRIWARNEQIEKQSRHRDNFEHDIHLLRDGIEED